MAYSLADVPALGFDLVRLPRGPDVVRVLVLALHAGEAELERLATHHPGPGRRARWQQVRAAAGRENAVQALRLAGPGHGLGADGEHRISAGLLARLERAPLGDLDALDRLVRHAVLDWTWRCEGQQTCEGEDGASEPVATQASTANRAADVLVDAAAAGFCATLPPALRQELWSPFDAATRASAGERHGHERDELGLARAVPFLAGLGTTFADEKDAWRRVCDRRPARRDHWALAMRDAALALHLSGRVRTSAVCQLEAVTVFRRAGFTARDASYGVWDALSGVVQEHVVRDLLSDDARDALLEPWVRVYGSEPAA